MECGKDHGSHRCRAPKSSKRNTPGTIWIPRNSSSDPLWSPPKGERGREYWYIDGKIRGLARQAVTALDVRQLEEKLGRKMAAPQEAREGENVGGPAPGTWMSLGWISRCLAHPLPGASGRPPRGGGRGLQELQSPAGRHLAAGPGLPTLGLRTAVADYGRGPGPAALHTPTARWASSCAVSRTSICSTIPTSSPLYDAVSSLNMAIGAHAGNANPYVRELLAQRNAPGTFWAYRMSSIGAFHLVTAGLPDRFRRCA